MGYKFNQNTSCEHFPCHKNIKDKKFNCLFCFCPLYFLKDCGGNFKMKNEIKDCSNCTIPHSDISFEYVIKKLVDHLNYDSEKDLIKQFDYKKENLLKKILNKIKKKNIT